MRQYFPRLLTVLGLVTAVSFAGCGSEAGSGAPSTAADAGTEKDTGSAEPDGTAGGGGADAASSDAGNSDTGSTTTDAGAAPDPCAKCKDNQVCTDKKCVDKKVPCDGKCKAGEICDLAKNKCVTPSCKLPDAKTFTDNKNLNKILTLKILSDKDGCDLNDDGVSDNALGKIIGIYAQANDSIGKAVKDGSLVLLMSPDAWKTDKTKFTMDMLIGDVDPSTKDCDATDPAKCKYTVSESSYNVLFDGKGTCPAKVNFDPTVVDGDKMTAGGNKQVFELNLPVAGVNLVLKISKAQFLGTVADKSNWKSTKDAMLCGVLSKKDLDAAIDAVPDEVLKGVGFDKATIKSLVAGVLKPDIDLSGDGESDAISVALGMTTAPVTVTGYTKK